jgi:hypothetical protein
MDEESLVETKILDEIGPPQTRDAQEFLLFPPDFFPKKYQLPSILSQ